MQARVANLTDAELAAFANLLSSTHYVLLANTLALHDYNLKQMVLDSSGILAYSNTNTIPDTGPGGSESSAPPPDAAIADLLTAQGRQLVLTGGVYTVTPIP
jgi:hypothetical protein